MHSYSSYNLSVRVFYPPPSLRSSAVPSFVGSSDVRKSLLSPEPSTHPTMTTPPPPSAPSAAPLFPNLSTLLKSTYARALSSGAVQFTESDVVEEVDEGGISVRFAPSLSFLFFSFFLRLGRGTD